MRSSLLFFCAALGFGLSACASDGSKTADASNLPDGDSASDGASDGATGDGASGDGASGDGSDASEADGMVPAPDSGPPDDAGADAAPAADAAVNPACNLPIDLGTCGNGYRAFAHDPATGACLPLFFSRCGPVCTTGNANCFETKEACEAACATTSPSSECPAERELVQGCVECGVVGGCQLAHLCALSCETSSDCTKETGTVTPYCSNGVCVPVAGCI